MRLTKHFRVRGVVVGLVIGLALGGTIAHAAIPDTTSGRITACYPTSGPNKGRLSVIDAAAGQTCGAGTAAVAWQQRAFCDDWPHAGVDWSMPGSTPGNGCNFVGLGFPSGLATNANFTNANLTNADISQLGVQGADFTGANLTGTAVGFYFTNAQLRSASAVVGIRLGSMNITGWDLSNLDLSGADLTHATATSTNFSNAKLGRAVFTEANLTSANFTGADLTGADMSYALLTHANLTGAKVGGIRWYFTTCPDGTASNKHANSCAGHLTG